MAWLFWLAVPVVLTLITAVFTWWRGRPPRGPRGVGESVRAHQQFLDALGQAPRQGDQQP